MKYTYDELVARVKQLEQDLSIATNIANRYEMVNRLKNELMHERSSFASKLYPHGLSLHPNGDVKSIWMPTDDFVVRFDDKTAEPRTSDQLDKMVEALRNVANEYDFDLKQWGSGEAFLKFATLQLRYHEEEEKDENHGTV